MKYIKLYIPVIALIICWLLFELLKKYDNNICLGLSFFLALIMIVIVSIKVECHFIEGFEMLIVYNIINYIMYHIFYKQGWFLSGIEYAFMFMAFVLTSIVGLIIFSIKSLSKTKDKKSV